MSTLTTESVITPRRTPEQRAAYLRQQLARTEAEIARKSRAKRTRGLIVIGATVCRLRDPAVNARLIGHVAAPRDREIVQELLG